MKIGYTHRMVRTLLTVLVLTVLPTPVFAEWTKVRESVAGETFYVDFERIRKHGGFVYLWLLEDYLTPTKFGHLSVNGYRLVDCELFRLKWLSVSSHKEQMGEGIGESHTPQEKWIYHPPDSPMEMVLKTVCAYAK